ncbi:MAG: hypothetical protein JNL10_01365 [Verrucomicrobiales bacterium]|nr:hypothetical protein [Verrucomicrobiales bacterium]
MKILQTLRSASVVLGVWFAWNTALAQLIYSDHFDYPDGELVGAANSPWVVNYLPDDGALVSAGRLVLTDARQESVRVAFPTAYSSGNLYARMTVNFSALPSGDGNYFAFFRGNSVDNLRGRVWASTNDAAPGKFRLGITTIQAPATLIERDLDLGTDYQVVVRYTMPQSSCTLWINPVDENDTSSRVDYEVDERGWSIREFGFLQTAYYHVGEGNYVGTLTVDDLRIGRTFTDVLPALRITEITSGPGGILQLRATGAPAVEHVLQASTHLLSGNWLNLSTNTAGPGGLLEFTDPDAGTFPARFYRWVIP